MSVRKIAFALGEYFHVYNRGNSKQEIFKDASDYVRFQNLLFMANGTEAFVFRNIEKEGAFEFKRGSQLVHIGAYCLMPNHYHILLKPAVESGVQIFMQKLATGYSMYFNKKYERTGSLFEGKFRAQHADSDEYLKYLFSYIHLNPVKLIQSDWKEVGINNIDSIQPYLSSYRYSSFLDYFSEREETKIITPSHFPEYFSVKKEIDAELISWLEFDHQPST